MKQFDVISPVDGSVYVSRGYASPTDIDRALTRAQKAGLVWRQKPVAERADICRKAVDCLRNYEKEISQEISWQMGRPVRYGGGELNGVAERATYMIDIAGDTLKDIVISDGPTGARYIAREPVGTVLTIAPWNYPFLTAINSVVPALMAGNAVLLKHATQTPLCAERLVAAFLEAGLPEDVFQFLHMTHEDTARAIQSGHVQFVCFTGSVGAGRQIERTLAGQFIGSGLELGGKDPAYVRADANITHAIESLVDGAFFNSGQSCCGIERIYVHQSRFDDFVAGFRSLTSAYVLGDPLDNATTLGPLVNKKAADFVRGQIADAVAAGAQPLIDANLFDRDTGQDAYVAPQVLVGVDHTMSVMKDESFGPVVGIMPVADDEEAVALMNDSPFGLTASVWTEDIDAAKLLGAQVRTGTFFMNRCDYLDPALAWTGVGDTGRGCTLSRLGYDALTQPKSYHLKIVS